MSEYIASRIASPGDTREVFVEGARTVKVEEFKPDGTLVQWASQYGEGGVTLIDPPQVGDILYAQILADGEVEFPAGWSIEYPPNAEVSGDRDQIVSSVDPSEA